MNEYENEPRPPNSAPPSGIQRRGNTQADCNTGSTVWPNGLPPGWCIQQGGHQVALWYDKTVFILKNPNADTMRATVRRTFGNGVTENFDFDVPKKNQTPQIPWLVGTDTGFLELLSVVASPDDQSLSGMARLRLENRSGPAGMMTMIVNEWPCPVYVSANVESKTQTSWIRFKDVVYTHSVIAGYADAQLTWRAAVLQRKDLYSAWPPIGA